MCSSDLFAVTAVHRHAVHAAGFGGIAARFEDSDRPQPLVYPYLLFHDVLYGMKTERAAGETSGKALCRGPSGYKGRKNFFRRARIFGCGRRTGLPFAAGGMPAAPSVAGTAGGRAHGAWSPFCPVIYQINGIKCGKRDNFLYFRRQPMTGLTRLIDM